MSAGFTPGPWTCEIGEPSAYWTEWPSGDKWQGGGSRIEPIGIYLPWSDKTEARKANSIANARLIAAAPDLHEALFKLANEAFSLFPHAGSGNIPMRDALAALAKARGDA